MMINKKVCIAFLMLLILDVVSLALSVDGMFLLAFNVCISSFIFAVSNIRKRLLYFFFLIAFFTYLIGGHVCYEYFGMEIKYYYGDSYYFHSNLCVFIALVALLLGYVLSEHLRIKKGDDSVLRGDNAKKSHLRYRYDIKDASRLLFYGTYAFWIIDGVYDAFSVLGGNYYNIYSGTSSAPFLIRAGAALTPYFFYLFIATLPNKKECRLPLVMYCLYAVLSLFSGQRRSFVNMILFVMLYFIYRNYRDVEGKWIQKKHIVFCCVLIPAIMITTFLWNYYRLGTTYEGDTGIISLLFGFFQQQGFSSSVIRLEKYYEDSLNADAFYSFYTTVKNFRLNTVIKLLFNPQYGFSYYGHSAEFATKGNSLDNALSYLVLWKYSMGAGVGSCYLAELYHDFGYVGVFVGNIFYGIVIQRIQRVWNNTKKHNVWLMAIGFAMVDAFLKVPRWNFDLIFSYFLDFGMWVSFAVVLCVASFVRKRQKHVYT